MKYLLIFFPFFLFSQTDSVKLPWYNIHFQQTVIDQEHPAFNAKYTGFNSLDSRRENDFSITSTLFFGLRLWKGASVFINPELAGGSGFSQARGIAGFPNGETFRIGSSTPAVYLARGYLQQIIPLSKKINYVDDDLNQIKGKTYERQIRVMLGKFSIADFFDFNAYSHDPRTHFMNWALMNNGAWDYPANTRGYTIGGVIEYTSKYFAIRYGLTEMPTYANGPVLNSDIQKANASTLELQFNYAMNGRKGYLRLLGFYNQANMGSYSQAVKREDTVDITLTRSNGRSKYGYGINLEQELSGWSGMFVRVGWNDGKNETWAFTEIDQTVQVGLSFNGKKWKRTGDELGVAAVVNGISTYHRGYLKAGGYGFIVGDGNLNYGQEMISEIYYNFAIRKVGLIICPGYQYVVNPAYNKDRGPVHVFSLRFHVQI